MGVREAGARLAGALGPIIRDVVSRCLGFGAYEESAGMERGRGCWLGQDAEDIMMHLSNIEMARRSVVMDLVDCQILKQHHLSHKVVSYCPDQKVL